MHLEPVGSSPIPAPALGHADPQTLFQATALAGGPRLPGDGARAAGLALRQCRGVAIATAEERLK